MRQNAAECSFGTDSWVILSPIEQRIKYKIERVGVPLKDWDIQINYGIKTGFNEAFIISGEKRKELIEQDPKSDEIIRPILRGRDIKRYGYEFADLYLICTFPAKHIDIEQYPAVKNHLLSFGIERLEQTGKEHIVNGEEIKARKKTNNKWFETQDQIGYWNDFFKQKIAWASVGETYYSLIPETHFLLDTNYFLTTSKNIKYLLAILNSKLIKYWINSEDTQIGSGGAYRHYKYNLEKLHVPNVSIADEKYIEQLLENKEYDKIESYVFNLYQLTDDEIKFISSGVN